MLSPVHMRLPDLGWNRRIGRWALALLLLPPLLLREGVELLYRYGLSRVDGRPQAPEPHLGFASRVLWAVEEPGPLRLEPRWSWTLVADFAHAAQHPRRPAPASGSRLSGQVAGRWLFSRPGGKTTRTLTRHTQELALSIWISRHWSAEELLTVFAQRAPFGPGITGLEAAARTYFDKEPGQLALHEAALLAGLPRSPTRYDPFCHPERARQRREAVLSRLLTLGWISEPLLEDARKQPLLPPDIVARHGRERCQARNAPEP